jgi:hypothetical protein
VGEHRRQAKPDRQAVVSPPLVGAAALMPGARPAQAIGHTPVTPDAAGNPERVYAVTELRAAGTDPAVRRRLSPR